MSEFNKEAFLEHIRIHRNESNLDTAKWAWMQQQAIIDDLKAKINEQNYTIDALQEINRDNKMEIAQLNNMDDVQVIADAGDIHDVFQKWFKEQDFYQNLRYQEGNRLFLRDGDVYRYLPVHMTFVAWSEKQKRVDGALQMLSDWDDQTYRDDAEQLIGELGDVLRGEHESS